MKKCPICNAWTFDDQGTCYGCMHRFEDVGDTCRDRILVVGAIGNDLANCDCVNDAEAARKAARERRYEEVWVDGTANIANINVAAAIKEDDPQTTVKLIVANVSGSLMTRAHAADIDEIVERNLIFREVVDIYFSDKNGDNNKTQFNFGGDWNDLAEAWKAYCAESDLEFGSVNGIDINEVFDPSYVPPRKHDNQSCPMCGSGDAEGSAIEVMMDGSVQQKCRCNECGARWNDVYEFKDCEDIEPGDRARS